MFNTTKFAPSDDRILYSGGAACSLLTITPAQLGVLMEACNVKFSWVLDTVPYLTVDDFNACARKAREILNDVESTLAAAPNN